MRIPKVYTKKIGHKNKLFLDSLLEYCNGSDEKAFDVYFELLDEFKLEKGIK